jgi:Flp pilus assembly CpaE family ATPase
MSEQHLIAPKQIETALGYGIHHSFTSDYRTVSEALNSGVPLAMANHSELAAEFASFTRLLLGQTTEEQPAEPERRRVFLGMF